MKLTIKSTHVLDRKIKAKSGQEYTFREQEAVVEMGEERRLIVVSLDDSQVAYPVGQYDILDASFEVDRNRCLTLKRKLALKALTVAAGVGGVARQTG